MWIFNNSRLLSVFRSRRITSYNVCYTKLLRGAYRLGRGYLELRAEEVLPDLGRTVLVLCATGARSLFAAERNNFV